MVGNSPLGGTTVDGRIKLYCALKKQDGTALTGLSWLRMWKYFVQLRKYKLVKMDSAQCSALESWTPLLVVTEFDKTLR